MDAPLVLLAVDLLGGRLAVLGGLLLPGLVLLLASLEPCVLLVLRLGAADLTVVLLASPGLALVLEGRSLFELALEIRDHGDELLLVGRFGPLELASGKVSKFGCCLCHQLLVGKTHA
mgnify:CR=1 FL=1